MRSHMEEVPRDIKLQIAALEASNRRTLTALMLSSQTLYKANIGDKLLLDFACSNKVSAKNILARHPELLFYAATIKDHSNHTLINVTPLEVAFGADDAAMCHMALPFLDQIPTGRASALRLLEKRFFNQPQPGASYNFADLVAIFMNQDDFSLMKEAAFDFQNQFKPGAVLLGKPFDLKVLINAVFACRLITKTDNSSFTTGSHNFRRAMFWKLVVGWLERSVPDHYAKLICADFKKVPVTKDLLKDPYFLGYGDVFYPLDVKPNYQLGKDYGIIATGKLRYGVATVAGSDEGDRLHNSTSPIASYSFLTRFYYELSQCYEENQISLHNFINQLREPAPLSILEEISKEEQERTGNCTIL